MIPLSLKLTIIKHLTHEIDYIPLYWGEEIIPFISYVTNTVEFRVKGLSEMKDRPYVLESVISLMPT